MVGMCRQAMMMMIMMMMMTNKLCKEGAVQPIISCWEIVKFSAAKKVEQLEASHDGDDINDNEDDNNDNAKKKVEHLEASLYLPQ